MSRMIRAAQLLLKYDGVDISADISDYVTEFSYTDNSGGCADDLSVTLEDREQLWKGGWCPVKGAKLEASIVCEGFARVWTPGQVELPCGTFELDEIEMASGRSGDTVTLKGVSAMVANSIRREKKTRPWENITLSGLADNVVSEHGLTLQFEGQDREYIRVEQREESDLSFLKRLAEDEGKHVKLADNRVIIYSGEDYDRHPVSMIIERGHPGVVSTRISSKLADVYRACTVKYSDPSDKTLKAYTFTPPNPPRTKQVLQMNRHVYSVGQAEILAKAALRKKNQTETSGEINMMGNVRAASAMVIRLTGYGHFSGKYFVDRATHTFTRGEGLTTAINIRKVLDY